MTESPEKTDPAPVEIQPVSLISKSRPQPEKPLKPVKLKEKEDMGEFFKTALIAVVLALVIRSFLYEPFNIPSGSMKPTLLVGDYLFVSKPAYGYSKFSFPLSSIVPIDGRVNYTQPERGDVIVFKLPSNPRVDYIKRVVGLPGETVQVKAGRLYINGKIVDRESVGLKEVGEDGGYSTRMMEYIETLPGGVIHRIYEESDNQELDNTPEFTVPANHFFMMGDNRDNSQDSRVTALVGPVPFENIVGRADILFFSVDETANMYRPWTWPGAIRFGRLFNAIGPVRPEGQGS
jgi:signal peptidase I